MVVPDVNAETAEFESAETAELGQTADDAEPVVEIAEVFLAGNPSFAGAHACNTNKEK